jgi:PAS domain-containing protein
VVGGWVALLAGATPALAQVQVAPRPWSSLPLLGAAVAVLAVLAGAFSWWRRMRRVVAAKEQAEALSARRRHDAEEALRTTERQMQQLVHSVKAIVWRMDVVTERFTFVSQEAEQLLGYPISNWTDDAGFFPAMLHADDRDWVVRYCRRATLERRDHAM